nr:YetF domain-containing protein [Halobacillus campisalis]
MDTPGDLQLTVQPFDLPRTIIKERKLLKEELLAAGKREGWVKAELNAQFQNELKDVLLATIDGKDKLKVFYYC